MTKDEALAFDLALEALEFIPESGSMLGAHAEGKRVKAITAIKQARALDKMADNARELGLDYEPADGTQVSKVWWDGEKLMAKPIPLEDFYLPAPVQKPVPDYAWPTVADYEKDVGFEVNDAFKMAWGMARTTNALFTQVEKNT